MVFSDEIKKRQTFNKLQEILENKIMFKEVKYIDLQHIDSYDLSYVVNADIIMGTSINLKNNLMKLDFR